MNDKVANKVIATPATAKAKLAKTVTEVPVAAKPEPATPTPATQAVASKAAVAKSAGTKAKLVASDLAKASVKQPEETPKVVKAERKPALKKAQKKAAKDEKPAKVKKPKLVRDSYAMPELEYQQIGGLKKRLVALGHEAKKSELLRAGIALLSSLNDVDLKAAVERVERIKTGRPSK